MKRKKGSLITLVLSIIIISSIVFSVTRLFTNEKKINKLEDGNDTSGSSEVSVDVINNPKVDIMVTQKDNDLDMTNFDTDVINRLKEYGIDTEDINIKTVKRESVSTNASDANEIFNNWGRIGVAGDWSVIQVDGVNTINNAENTNDYSGFYCPDNYENTDMVIEFDNRTTSTDDDVMGCMFRFNLNNNAANANEKTCTTYIFALDKHDSSGLGISNGEYNGLLKITNNKFAFGSVEKLATIPDVTWTRNTWEHYKIVVKRNNIKIYQNNNLIIDYTDNSATAIKSGSYGFFSYSQDQSQFKNFVMEATNTKSFKDLLLEPSWRNNAYHIVVNVDDEIDESLTGTDAIGEILSRTLNDKIHLVQWGTDTNREGVENFIARNDNKGMFTQNNDYTNAVDKTAEYIKNLIENNSASQYVIAGENSNILVSPEELKTGATSVDYKDGRWRVHHNYTYFANDLGQSKNTEIYTPDLMFNFDKPGKYDIYFDDTLVKEVYAHRRPVADFKIRNNEGFMLTSTSYDLDDDEDIGYGKGIASEKWYYKKVNETDWIEGKMNNFIDIQDNKYLVKLEVTDKQGETSYITKYLGAGKPIADFNYVESTITKYQDLEIKDISYDPLGKEITAWSWTLKKDGVEVGTYTERVPTVLNFNNEELGVGNYVYELVVTNSDGDKSEVFKRGFTVTEDVTAPEVIIEPTSCDWRKFQKVEVIFSDKDSGFKNFKYAVDENIGTSEETNWSEEIEETEYIVLIEEHGLKYLHIQALDNAGNLLERTVGIYKMDLVPPTGTYELTPPTEDRRAVLVTVTGEDDLSGVSRIILPDGTEVKGNTATYEVTVPGEYKALVVDKANNGTDVIIQVNVESEGVEAKYIDQVTGEEISPKEKITGGVGEIYNFVAKEIEGYTLVKEPSNAIGEFAFGKIEVVFEYRKVSKVTTKYINAVTGEEIIERVENTYKQGESYSEHAKEIGGYVLVEEASNKEGIVGDKDIEVIHRYKQLSGGVIVKYIDQVTGEALLQNIEIPGIEKTPYETEAKDITGYELVEIPSNATGEMGVDAIEVVYEYRKTSKVITKYIDASTKKEIIERTEVTYKEGERYTTTPQDKAEYILTKEPTNKEGIVGRNDIEVVYEYRKMSSGLIVKYIDYVSNEMLDEKIYEGNENDKIKLDIKEFEGYAIYIKPNKEEVSLTVSLQEVKIYYRKKVKLQIIGIDETTKEELYREEKEGIEGDTYKTEGREIGGYILEREPDNKKGVYLRSKTEVIYGYRKSSEGVKVTYIDRETGEILGEERINGLEGESYSVEIKEFDKYEYKDSEGNIEGKFKKELIEVKCYYEKKKGKVEVVYEDEEGNEIFKEELIGKVGERYKVEEKNIRNYSIKTRPEVTEGEYKEEKITVKYILTRLKGKVTVRIIDEKGKELDRIEQEGYAGDICYIRLPVYELYENTEEDQISIEYTDSEIVIEVIYKKIEKQIKPVDPTNPSNPEKPNEPDRPIRRPYPLPDTSDINLWLYVKIFVISILVIALIVYIIRKVNKSKNKKAKK